MNHPGQFSARITREIWSIFGAQQHHSGEAGHSKRECALRASARYGRYLKQTRAGLAIDRQAVAAAERLDGKFVVHSNDDTLSAADMALGYKQLQRVEEAWRMKSGLRLRPVFHWAVHRIHAHVAITVRPTDHTQSGESISEARRA